MRGRISWKKKKTIKSLTAFLSKNHTRNSERLFVLFVLCEKRIRFPENRLPSGVNTFYFDFHGKWIRGSGFRIARREFRGSTYLRGVHYVTVNRHDQIVMLFLVVVFRKLDVQRGPAGRGPGTRAAGPADHGRRQVRHLDVVDVVDELGEIRRRHVRHVPFVHCPGHYGRFQHVVRIVFLNRLNHASGGRRLYEAQRQRENYPTRQRGQQQ